jgi:hypothetical protein
MAARHDLQHQHEQGGPPGVRTAMIVADPHIVKALSNMNAIVSLANGNLGQALLMPLLKDDTLIRLGREVIRPFYRERSDYAKSVLASASRRTCSVGAARSGRRLLPLALDQRPAHPRRRNSIAASKNAKCSSSPATTSPTASIKILASPTRMPAPHLLAAAAHRARRPGDHRR